ncbi:MAG: hypothetical protein H6513_17325 [Acidimicrobiaceae bacterium]|nr:hypothetical protein [Ilumatobacter sp.]MCB9382449.1 hypothetical protein [Acidimicrobiaceae bacterium]
MSRRFWRLARLLQVVAATAFLTGGLLGGSAAGNQIVVAGFFVLLLSVVLAWPGLPAAMAAADPDGSNS